MTTNTSEQKKLITDYQYESQVSFIKDRTEQLIAEIKNCYHNLNKCQHKEEMRKQFGHYAENSLFELADCLTGLDGNDRQLGLDFEKTNKILPMNF